VQVVTGVASHVACAVQVVPKQHGVLVLMQSDLLEQVFRGASQAACVLHISTPLIVQQTVIPVPTFHALSAHVELLVQVVTGLESQ